MARTAEQYFDHADAYDDDNDDDLDNQQSAPAPPNGLPDDQIQRSSRQRRVPQRLTYERGGPDMWAVKPQKTNGLTDKNWRDYHTCK